MPSSKPSSDLQQAARLHQAGKLAEAIAAYRTVVASQPRNADALSMLAAALHQSGNDAEAVPLFNRALMLDPGNVHALRGLLALWQRQENWQNVLQCAQMLAAQSPSDPQTQLLLAGALAQAEKFEEAAAAYRRILANQPSNVFALHALAEVLRQAGKHPQAQIEYQKLLGLRPNDLLAWIGYSDALRWQHEIEKSLAASQRAMQIDPNSADAMHLVGWNLLDLGRPAEALPIVERAIRSFARQARLHWLFANILLMLGQLPQGLDTFESRWEVRGLRLKRPRVSVPQWRGEDVRGKVVYLHPEQGLGDTLNFIRYAPLIVERGAAKVIMTAPPPLHRLLERSIPQVTFVKPGEAMQHLDLYCPIMSLPLAFGTTLQTIPANVPYLFADAERAAQWKARLSEYPGLKVGVAWAGRPSNPVDFHRTIHIRKLLGLAMPGVQLVSLQKGEGAAQLPEVPDLNILNWTDELKDFDDTAALVDALDLVIAVDSAAVHLAGAMGKKTWLPSSVVRDWRWFMNRDDSPWYPTLRLFRQSRRGEWEPVIAIMIDELRREMR